MSRATLLLVDDELIVRRLLGDALARAILDDTPVPTPIEDAVANMAVIEALVRSSKSGTWV